MYKSNTELIMIDAKATEPIPTNVVFWSHDKGTAKLVFELKKDTIPQSLAEGTKVPILLEFSSATAEGGMGKHTYFATIDDAIEGIVSIVLEDNILGYVGRVDGSIYIELPDSRSLDTAGRFTFDIKRSPIDENVPELEDYYWQGFNEIMAQYHQTIAGIETESERLLNELQARILTLEEKLDNVELRARFKTAWSWSADGTDRFTTVYPGENYVLKSKEPYTATGDGTSNQYPIEIRHIRFGADVLNGQATIQYKATISNYTSGTFLRIKMYDAIGIWSSFGEWNDITGNSTKLIQWKGTLPPLKDGGILEFRFNTDLGANIKIEELCIREGTDYYAYTPAPSEDPINAYPQYKGISIVDSDNPADYSWQAEDNTIAKKTDLTKDKVGLGNVDNYSTATQAEAEAGTATNKFMTPLRTKQLFDSKLLNMVYPIGSIYMSVNSATPATLFGGTWERFSKGRVLVGVDESDTVLATSGKQGGSTNPLTAHTHVTQLTTYRVTSGTGSGSANNLGRATDVGDKMTGEFGSVTSTGDNTYHNNWQPFTTVYMWKRTA
jgi:hypothetical protein